MTVHYLAASIILGVLIATSAGLFTVADVIRKRQMRLSPAFDIICALCMTFGAFTAAAAFMYAMAVLIVSLLAAFA